MSTQQTTSTELEEKLSEILDLMHPGHWSAFDYRRAAILRALGIDGSKLVWDKDPYESV
jgi:hypothetical protein